MVITRTHKLNEKNRNLGLALKTLTEHLRDSAEETERLRKAINKNYEEIGLFRGMTDEEFNKTKYRQEDFKPL